MKPSGFVYHRPDSLEEALEVLSQVGDEGKVLAGGQSLIPMLSMRLAAPAHLVDINRVDGLATVEVAHGRVVVGATVRHSALERHEEASRAIPLLAQALTHVAHPTIRNRGTSVGSLVHADPAGEMPAVLSLLDGTVQVASLGGTRQVSASDFFLGPMESAVKPGEMAVSAQFARPPSGTGSAWQELSRRHGDYAMCGVGALVTLDADRRVTRARVGLISVGPTPVLVDVTEAVGGQSIDDLDPGPASELVDEAIDPEADIHASADYRGHLARVLTSRALTTAARSASPPGSTGEDS
ncbi:MAG: xanthine dehydrogenase family protein subunit M [Nocardioidaceae bacterium]